MLRYVRCQKSNRRREALQPLQITLSPRMILPTWMVVALVVPWNLDALIGVAGWCSSPTTSRSGAVHIRSLPSSTGVLHWIHAGQRFMSAFSNDGTAPNGTTGGSSSGLRFDDFTPRVEETVLDLVPEPDEEELTKEEMLERSTCIAYDYSDKCLPSALLRLPRHSHAGVRAILEKTESILQALHKTSKQLQLQQFQDVKERAKHVESIFANNYVDLGKIDTVGFDYDYTLVTYTDDLLELIYERALKRLVADRQYPSEMLQTGLKYDPFFSIRGLAVDKETGWITHLSYTHKVAVAWEGREKLPTSRLFEEYRVKRALTPTDRKKRLKPLNDLFSMAECCLIADVIQFFKDRDIPFSPRNVVNDVLKAVTDTHLSGEFHTLVANNPQKYFVPTPHLKQVLGNLKAAGKRLIFVSNSPFWYVDAGMRYIFGSGWRKEWDAIITSAGKPNFYTDSNRPFREVCQETRRILFREVEKFEPGKIYTEGCLKELMRLMDWTPRRATNGAEFMTSGSHETHSANVLYIGDSLFADLVDAKRDYGWTTAAVTPEVAYEMEIQNEPDFILSQQSIELLLNALRMVQDELGTSLRTEEDVRVLNSLEQMVSLWRDRETYLLGNPFGSVFRARYQPSLFAHSLRRYCDLYMTSVSSLRFYSPQHRFYPEQTHRLLAHEIQSGPVCWTLEELMDNRDSESV